MPRFYDLASVYDILHTPGTAEEVDGLERIALRYVRTKGRGRNKKNPHPSRLKTNDPPSPPRGEGGMVWLEPACGTGRFLRVVAGRGTPIVGIDLNPAMVAYARGRIERLGLGSLASVRLADITDFRLRAGSVDFAFNLINTVRHLPSDAAVLSHFACVRRTLRAGGVYAVGLNWSDPGLDVACEDVWEARRGRVQVTQVVQFIPPTRGSRRERAVNHLIVTRPSGEEHVDAPYTLRTYTRPQWDRLVARSGFEPVAIVDEYGDEHRPGPTGYGIHVLRRAMGNRQ